jgi:hypothetical protein
MHGAIERAPSGTWSARSESDDVGRTGEGAWKGGESRVRGLENTAEADEKHLRRILQRQERERALLLARSDRLRRRTMGDVQEPTTRLGQILAERNKK